MRHLAASFINEQFKNRFYSGYTILARLTRNSCLEPEAVRPFLLAVPNAIQSLSSSKR